MLFFVFAVIGFIIGAAIILLTRQFRKTNKSRLVVFSPCIVSLLVSIFLMYIGNVQIEGIEGAAYMLLSLIIFSFSATVLYLTDKKWT
ncbi:hypothetical protein CFK40_01850 [Virgibacillus necropolis]|uniref:YesK-like protein n=1 Tax=Virgibacillus necropolis TaxID=163877 RepID=A0A221M872_9BACI|nr:hypothetical protein CFK40_01850 [Virgibacillus necropolis]